MKQEKNTNIVAEETAEVKQTFADLIRNFEAAYASGRDYGHELTALATAVAYSILNKLTDPQRKTAAAREEWLPCGAYKTSDNGLSNVMVKAKRDIYRDSLYLGNLTDALADASTYEYDKDGNARRVVVNEQAEQAAAALMADSLGDGLDFVNEAAAAILEQAEKYAALGGHWLEKEVEFRRLSKRVYIDPSAVPEYREEVTTPIQQVYRAVRKYVQDNRAVSFDPRNGYTYVDMPAADDLDRVYYRSSRYADLGGYDCNGNYTGDMETSTRYNAIVSALNLSTTREAFIVSKREQGYSVEAIAAALKVDPANVSRIIRRIQDKAAAIGVAPKGWTADSRKADPAQSVEQIDSRNGERIAVYASVTAAANMTGINKGSISAACNGRRQTAAGYVWRYI